MSIPRTERVRYGNYSEVADSIPNKGGRPAPRNPLSARHGLGRPTGEWAGDKAPLGSLVGDIP